MSATAVNGTLLRTLSASVYAHPANALFSIRDAAEQHGRRSQNSRPRGDAETEGKTSRSTLVYSSLMRYHSLAASVKTRNPRATSVCCSPTPPTLRTPARTWLGGIGVAWRHMGSIWHEFGIEWETSGHRDWRISLGISEG